ncbi:MAG: EAL domain-containing protein [Lachnospiraceae bacterium]|nr:EAL domain-containing protein [Lachnospiraceae bacterium]
MNKQKERKIRRITKIRIWPRVLGALCVFLLFHVLLVALVLAYASSVASSKIENMMSDCSEVADYMDSFEYGLNDNRFGGLMQIRPEIVSAGYLDEDYNVVSSFGKKSVDTTEYAHLANIENDLLDADVYVEKAGAHFFSFDGAEIEMKSEQLLFDITVSEVNNDDADWFNILELARKSPKELRSRELVGTNVIFVFENDVKDGYSVIVYRFRFVPMDFISMLIFVIALMAVFLLLMLYQLFSIIRLFMDKRTAYDALYTDMVTGGGNELSFYKDAEKILRKHKNTPYAMVHLRLEKHEGLLACYGVKWVEELDEMIYETINKTLKKHKEVHARMNNGDFAVLMRYEDNRKLNDRVRSLMNSLSAEIVDQKLFFSAGICPVLYYKDDVKNLYNNASLARSYVKDENAEEIKWYTKEIEDEQLWERKVEGEMENAMQTGQFEMFLQPKYTTGGEVLGGAEALVRWRHPQDGLIPPGKFIPIFEKNGFILKLDDYMITEVAKTQAKWLSEGKKLVPISVNVSRAHFMKKDIAEHIRDIVDQYNVPHEVVELELTESAFFDDKKTLIDVVRKMREYGFPVSMDDFGSGYSSLNSLKEIPLDVLKLDAEFFRGEDVDDRGRLIVSEIIELAKTLGMHIVAEGIETRTQVDFLKDLECDLIQGYIFAKPMPIAEFETKHLNKLMA